MYKMGNGESDHLIFFFAPQVRKVKQNCSVLNGHQRIILQHTGLINAMSPTTLTASTSDAALSSKTQQRPCRTTYVVSAPFLPTQDDRMVHTQKVTSHVYTSLVQMKKSLQGAEGAGISFSDSDTSCSKFAGGMG